MQLQTTRGGIMIRAIFTATTVMTLSFTATAQEDLLEIQPVSFTIDTELATPVEVAGNTMISDQGLITESKVPGLNDRQNIQVIPEPISKEVNKKGMDLEQTGNLIASFAPVAVFFLLFLPLF